MLKKVVLGGIIILVLTWIFLIIVSKPSHDRQWATDQTYLPQVAINDNIVSIEYVRNFLYEDTINFQERYESRTINVDDIISIDYLVEPFGEWHGPAHTLLSFGFATPGGIEYIAVSVEIRKEVGESFSPLKGLFRKFELMYVVGTEEDLIQLRTNHRNDDVYLYPIETTKERMKNIFLSMMERIQGIGEVPEFYNTITNNCTSNIRAHVNEIVPDRVPWTWATILPADSDKIAYELGLIAVDLSFEEAREHFYITDVAQGVEEGQNFSTLIRSKRSE